MGAGPDDLARERARWRAHPRRRPAHIPPPGPGQESVWDYPRPPRLAPDTRRVRVELGGVVLADSTRALRVLETASPPTFYLPAEDVRRDCLLPSSGTSFCEWKGVAHYWSARLPGLEVADVAWGYPEPDPAYAPLRGRFAFFAGRVDACWVGDARVEPQPGDYYGGWITPEITGPFKGGPDSGDW